MVERRFSRSIKSIQSDLGGEYQRLHKTFASLGITHRQSCAHTHEQNGRVERRNRHVVETGLTLLAESSVPQQYWDYAFETATYLINCLPSSALQFQSPYFRLYKSPPPYSFFRVFGCQCYPYLRPYNRHKIEYRSTPCVFLGYPVSFRGYRCMDLTTGKTFICRHVRFDESDFPFTSSTSQEDQLGTQALIPWGSSCVVTALQPTVVQEPQPLATEPAPLAIEGCTSAEPSGSNRTQPHERGHTMRLRHMTRGTDERFYALHISVDPTCYSQAVGHPQWREAMDQEFNALLHNSTWRLIPAEPHMNIIGCKWVFRTKRKADGTIERHKARLVAKGYNQVAGEDFFDTFSPVVKPTTVRMLFSIAVSQGWTLRQLDVHNAFLNGHLAETVYMKQPPGYEDPQHPDHVCLLQRSLYGLKQAPRAWFKRLHDYLLSAGFLGSKTDVSLFHYSAGGSRVFLLVYVDDIIMMGNDSALVDRLLQRLSTTFKIRDLGTPSFFLGIATVRHNDGLLLSQRRYMVDILTRAGMSDCKPLATPAALAQPVTPSGHEVDNPTQYRRIVGALQYLTITRPDLSFAVNRLCQFMHRPTEDHLGLLKRVLRYIKGTIDYGLCLSPSSSNDIHAYSDSDWAGCPVDRKSTSGYAVYLGTNLISWVSRKQRTVARSSTEAEYKALADVSAEVTWIVSLLRELGLHTGTPATLWCDNLGATYLAANPVFHARTKHVEIDYHFVRDKVASGDFQVNYVSTKDQTADILTKPLPAPRFHTLRDKLNVVAHHPCA